jgi:type I restriction enzyme M protein
VRAEHERGAAGRFAPGLPRISDGQLLFLLHMLAHAKDPKDGGSRIAIIMNGSPLFTGDAGSGESEIRRFILENDLLEALIALPEQLFYNTGIATYVWVAHQPQGPERKGKVQLIDATSFWVPMRKSLGDKRREIPLERSQDILKILADFKDGETRTVTKDGQGRGVVVSRIFPTTHFGFRKITVERPLRLNFQASPERIARLDDERLPGAGAVEEEGRRGREGAAEGRGAAGGHPQAFCARSRTRSFRSATSSSACSTPPPRRPASSSRPRPQGHPLRASERDETAAICRDKDGNPEPDPSCATPRACRSPRASRRSSSAR